MMWKLAGDLMAVDVRGLFRLFRLFQGVLKPWQWFSTAQTWGPRLPSFLRIYCAHRKASSAKSFVCCTGEISELCLSGGEALKTKKTRPVLAETHWLTLAI